MPLQTREFSRLTLTLLIASGMALLAIVLTSLALVEGTRLRTGEVTRAQEVRFHAYRLLSLVQDAETGQRGYLLTGDGAYQQPYNSARSQIPAELEALRAASGAPYTKNVEPLPRLVGDKLHELLQTIELARSGRQAAAMDIVRSGHGKALMDGIRGDLELIISTSDREVDGSLGRLRSGAQLLRVVSIAGGVLIAAFALGSTWIVRRYTQDLLAARREVDALNADLESRVRARTADLTRANEEIQKFAYIVSHDLRAPLVNIMGFSSEMEEALATLRQYFAETDPEKASERAPAARQAVENDLSEAIGFIRTSTGKMDGLINAILKLSREGGRVLTPEPVDLGVLVQRCGASIRHQLDEKGAELTLPAPLPTIVSDRLALEQVFGNLIDNAVKYLSPDRPGRIVVRGHNEGSRLVVEVEDNGRGIASQDHERIFELFRRAGLQDRMGDGIGLAHVRALVRRLGGEITVESELGRGSTFRVWLPRVLTHPAEVKAA